MGKGKKPPHERMRIYWDSCLFIDLVQRSGDHIVVLDQLVEAAKQEELVLVTSALTLAEVLGKRNKPSKPGGPTKPISPEEEQRIIDFFENPYISIRPCDRHTGQVAGTIARQFSLRPRDAIHVATALNANVPVMHTTDGPKSSTGLLKKNGKIGTPPLAIVLPTCAVQMRLTEVAPDDE